MGCGKLSEAKEVSPFNEKKDWGGYNLSILPYYVANSGYFFIFFPQQVHLTNLQVGDKAPVRKIVFKIKVD
jgi:beta-galactosidase beta subunit